MAQQKATAFTGWQGRKPGEGMRERQSMGASVTLVTNLGRNREVEMRAWTQRDMKPESDFITTDTGVCVHFLRSLSLGWIHKLYIMVTRLVGEEHRAVASNRYHSTILHFKSALSEICYASVGRRVGRFISCLLLPWKKKMDRRKGKSEKVLFPGLITQSNSGHSFHLKFINQGKRLFF